MKKIILITAICALCIQARSQWSLTGNAGTNASTNFIGTPDNVAFKIRTNNAVRLTINGAGKVGIGTTSPMDKFHVNGTGGLARFGTGTTAATYSYWYTGNDVGSYIEQRGNTTTAHSDNLRIQSSLSGLGVDYSQFQIDPTNGFLFISLGAGNGNVGIGTYSPAYKLTVSAAVALPDPVAFIENTNADGGGFNGNGLRIKAGSNINSGSSLISFLKPDGAQIGSITQGIGVSQISFNSTSDKRLKNIIGASQKGLSDLMKINIYDYTFKSDPAKKILTGFMAQELYDIFPQSVSKPRENNEPAEKNPWMVDYGSVTPLIIRSVQEQQQMIDELKKSNDDLKQQNAEMKSRLDKFENVLSGCCTGYKAGALSPKLPVNTEQAGESSHDDAAKLEQNQPNPFAQSTVIKFYIPQNAINAFVKIYSPDGVELKSIPVSTKGFGQIEISGKTLSAGTYTYVLHVDGKVADSKQMVFKK